MIITQDNNLVTHFHGEVHPKQKISDDLRLINDFITEQRISGIKSTNRILSHLKPLFNYLELRGLQIKDLKTSSAQDFQTWLSSLQKSDGELHYAVLSVVSIISMCSRFYRFLKEKSIVYSNPFAAIRRQNLQRKLPKDIPSPTVMNNVLLSLSRFWEHKTLSEQKMFYRAHVMAEVQYASGLRISELLFLKEEDIDLDRRTIFVREGKGGRPRTAWINEYAAEVLRIYLKQMRPLINGEDNENLFGIKTLSAVCEVYHKYLNAIFAKHKVGHFTSHSFRHALGCHLLKRGCDLRYIALILGHEDLNSTTIYTKVDKQDLKRELDAHHPRAFEKPHG